jgi:hypothetical protein
MCEALKRSSKRCRQRHRLYIGMCSAARIASARSSPMNPVTPSYRGPAPSLCLLRESWFSKNTRVRDRMIIEEGIDTGLPVKYTGWWHNSEGRLV